MSEQLNNKSKNGTIQIWIIIMLIMLIIIKKMYKNGKPMWKWKIHIDKNVSIMFHLPVGQPNRTKLKTLTFWLNVGSKWYFDNRVDSKRDYDYPFRMICWYSIDSLYSDLWRLSVEHIFYFMRNQISRVSWTLQFLIDSYRFREGFSRALNWGSQYR